MATRHKARRASGGDEDDDERAKPDAPSDLVESKVRPQMHVPGTGTENAVQVGPQPVDMTGYEGAYHKKDEPDNAPPYGLKIDENDPYGYTHHAQNDDHHWSGTAEQFEAQFK